MLNGSAVHVTLSLNFSHARRGNVCFYGDNSGSPQDGECAHWTLVCVFLGVASKF